MHGQDYTLCRILVASVVLITWHPYLCSLLLALKCNTSFSFSRWPALYILQQFYKIQDQKNVMALLYWFLQNMFWQQRNRHGVTIVSASILLVVVVCGKVRKVKKLMFINESLQLKVRELWCNNWGEGKNKGGCFCFLFLLKVGQILRMYWINSKPSYTYQGKSTIEFNEIYSWVNPGCKSCLAHWN